MSYSRILKSIFTDYDGTISEELYEYDDDGFRRSLRVEKNDGIERITNYFYTNDGLLSRKENFRRGDMWQYVEYRYEKPVTAPRETGLTGKVLTREIYHNPGGGVKYFHTFIFEEGRLLKQTQHAPDGGVQYEYICQYENGRRVRTLKANLEVYSSRIYDRQGVLREIRLATGGTIVFSYEPRQTRWDFDRYTVC